MAWTLPRAWNGRASIVSAACALVGCIPPRFASQLPAHDGMRLMPPTFDYGAETQWLTLPNGLRVALNPDPHANLVSVDVRYEVGSAEDPPDKPGLAHLVEHMTFAQRTQPGGPTLADELQLVTLDRNASTTFDATHFYSVALAPELDRLLALEATRLERGCRGIDQASFDRELAIVALEIGQRDPAGRDAIYADVFGAGHAYAHAPGGSAAGLTLADVCRFIDAHYAPDRAVLLVGGRFDPAALSKSVTARFGRIRHRATGALARVAPPRIDRRTTELHAAIAKPHALVVLPAAAWGSTQALDEALLDDLVVRGLEAFSDRKPWLVRADHGRLGGARAGARYISIEVDDPDRLDDAAAQVFALASVIARTSPSSVSATLERWRVSLLDRFESFISRARLCADALQFAGDRRCRVGELREMEIQHTERVAMRALEMATAVRRVIHVLPAEGASTTAELEIPAPDAPETDAAVWRSPIDPAEADRPIALPAALQTSDLSEFALPNGLHVVLASNFTQPIVDARLVFPVGATGDSAHDVLAHAAANLLDHNLSRRYSREDVATLRWLFELGMARYVKVTDHTTFRIQGPARFVDWHLWRLSWLIREGVYSSREVSGEIVRARLDLIRSEMVASYGIEADYLHSLAGDVIRIDGTVSAARAGEVLRRLLADLDELRTGGDVLRDDFVRARRAALSAALGDPSIPSATGSRLERAVTSHTAIAHRSLAAEIASTRLHNIARVIAQDLQPGRMVGVLSGQSADVAAAIATAGITAASTIEGATAAQ